MLPVADRFVHIRRLSYLEGHFVPRSMKFDLILKSISRYIQLDDYEKEIFTILLEPRMLKRKQFILEAGDVCKHSCYVNSGCLKGYTVDKEGEEHILNFAPEGWWIADIYSLISRRPGTLNIEAVEDSQVLMLSRDDQEKLFQKVPKFERFFRILTENALVANQQRVMNNLSLTAEERYLLFTEKYPNISEHVPQHNIASYLGITPEFLSKIRARLARKG